MPETDVESAGVSLAMGNGVSAGIAIIQQVLATIAQAVADSTALMEIVARLGERVAGTGIDAAPTGRQGDAGTERVNRNEWRPDLATSFSGSHPRQVTHPKEASRRDKQSYSTASRHISVTARAKQGETGRDAKIGLPGSTAPSIARADSRALATSSESTVPGAAGASVLSSGNVGSQLGMPSAAPTVIRYAGPASPGPGHEQPPHQATDPDAVIDGDSAPILAADQPTNRAQHQIFVGAAAPIKEGDRAAVNQPVTRTMGPSRRFASSVPTGEFTDETELGETSTTQATTGSLPLSEPKQGLLILDGAQLGRWVLDHLVTSASRPGAGTSGIDPRMTAIYPGAPLGA